jgi:AcrR family transcriptional regulator
MNATETRGRDRAATERAIVAAARAILVEQGFAGLGVNAVSRRAACDKQLVYRYFGGIEGVVERIGEDLADWVERALAPLSALGPPESYADLIERLLLGYLQALRDEPIMQRIVAWEVADPSPMVRRLAEARSRGLEEWMRRQKGALAPPPGVDAAALNALLIASVQHMALAAGIAGGFGGLALASESDWDRLRVALRQCVRRLYAATTPEARRPA